MSSVLQKRGLLSASPNWCQTDTCSELFDDTRRFGSGTLHFSAYWTQWRWSMLEDNAVHYLLHRLKSSFFLCLALQALILKKKTSKTKENSKTVNWDYIMANFGKVWRKLTTPFGRQEESKHHPYRHPSHFTDLDRERALAARVPSGNNIYL